jgi:DNA invertase Pin-like site-specific DNA recombinase
MIVRYARVSTDGQTLDAQQSALAKLVQRRFSLRKSLEWSRIERS